MKRNKSKGTSVEQAILVVCKGKNSERKSAVHIIAAILFAIIAELGMAMEKYMKS